MKHKIGLKHEYAMFAARKTKNSKSFKINNEIKMKKLSLIYRIKHHTQLGVTTINLINFDSVKDVLKIREF